MDFHGKIALVTGGAKGIGFECCQELLRNGVQKVCIVDKDQKKGEAAVQNIAQKFGEYRSIFIKTDVTKKSEMKAAFQTVIDTWKRLDIVINNAGIMDDINWEQQIAVNFNGVVIGSLLADKYMSKKNGGRGGTLINVASILAMQEMVSIPIYVATKYAILGFSRSLGMPFNYDKSEIRVLTMCPGVTITPLIIEAQILVTKSESTNEDIGDCLPVQTPENVAEGMIHLIKHGESGSVWVCEGGEPVYEVAFPDRRTLRKK